jgi:hypothetical protein
MVSTARQEMIRIADIAGFSPELRNELMIRNQVGEKTLIPSRY